MNAPFPTSASGDRIIGTLLSHVPYEPLDWILPKMVAAGHITALASPPSSGASSLAAYFISRVTTGQSLPDAQIPRVGGVLLWTSGQSLGAVTKRMLGAAGVDESKVITIGSGRSYDPITDLPALRAKLEEAAGTCLMAVIDHTRVRRGREAECEQCWRDLANFLRDTGIGGLVLCPAKRHRPKAIVDRTVDGALAREASIVLSLVHDMEAPEVHLTHHAVTRSKASICERGGGYEFSVQPVIVAGASVPVVCTVSPVGGTAEEIFGAFEAPPGWRQPEAIAWLKMRLAVGGLWVQDLQRLAREDDVSWSTIRRVKERVGVIIQVFGHRSVWSLSVFGRGQAGWGPTLGEASVQQTAPDAPAGGFTSWPTTSWLQSPWFPHAQAESSQQNGQSGQLGQIGQVGQLGQLGQLGQGAQPGYAGFAPVHGGGYFAYPASGFHNTFVCPETLAGHPHHEKFLDVVAAGAELMSRSDFSDGTTPDPKMAVAESVLEDLAPEWLWRQDIKAAVAIRMPDPN